MELEYTREETENKHGKYTLKCEDWKKFELKNCKFYNIIISDTSVHCTRVA